MFFGSSIRLGKNALFPASLIEQPICQHFFIINDNEAIMKIIGTPYFDGYLRILFSEILDFMHKITW